MSPIFSSRNKDEDKLHEFSINQAENPIKKVLSNSCTAIRELIFEDKNAKRIQHVKWSDNKQTKEFILNEDEFLLGVYGTTLHEIEKYIHNFGFLIGKFE